MNKLLTMGILFIGLTTSTFAKSSTVNFNKSCRNFSIATFEMSEGTVKAFFHEWSTKPIIEKHLNVHQI